MATIATPNFITSKIFTVETVTSCGVRMEKTKPSWRAPSTNARSSVQNPIKTCSKTSMELSSPSHCFKPPSTTFNCTNSQCNITTDLHGKTFLYFLYRYLQMAQKFRQSLCKQKARSKTRIALYYL